MARISNEKIMNLFREIDEIKLNPELTEEQKQQQIKNNHHAIVTGLSYFVGSLVKRYRKFPNYEDLLQEGQVGLLKAVKRFDHTRFPNFYLYCERWIKNSVLRAASHFDVVYNPNRSRVVYNIDSIDEEDPSPGPEEILFDKERQNSVQMVLKQATQRERDIINTMFGLTGELPQTLRGAGPTFGVTHERIRQIKNEVVSALENNETLKSLI